MKERKRNKTQTSISFFSSFLPVDEDMNIKGDVRTYKSGLGGAEHSNWTVFVVVPVTTAPGW